MAAPLMIAFNKGRLRRCSSPQPRYGLSVLEQHLQILLRGGDWSNIEVLHKVVQHIGRNERRQRGAKSNILDPQTQQRQQNAHCLLLVLPRRAEVALEMGIFFQFRIAMGGQHFAVGVDVDAFARRLLQQQLEVVQVVPGDDDERSLFKSFVELKEPNAKFSMSPTMRKTSFRERSKVRQGR